MNAKTGAIFLEGFILPLLAVVFVWLISAQTASRAIIAIGIAGVAYQISRIIEILSKQK